MLAGAARLGVCEADCASALWQAVGSSAKPPLVALFTLDTQASLEDKGGGGRLSPLGCAMLISVLRFNATACKQYGEALAALPAEQLAAVARDAGGCRVIEAYLEVRPHSAGWGGTLL